MRSIYFPNLASLRVPADQDIQLALQPIVSAQDTNRVLLHEGLLRARDGAKCDPLALVHAYDRGEQPFCFDHLTLLAAYSCLRHYPKRRLAINISGRTVASGEATRLLQVFDPIDAGILPRLTLEVTEGSVLPPVDTLQAFSRVARRAGARVVLDDVLDGCFDDLTPAHFAAVDGIKVAARHWRSLRNAPVLRTWLRPRRDFSVTVEEIENPQILQLWKSLFGQPTAWQGNYFGAPVLQDGAIIVLEKGLKKPLARNPVGPKRSHRTARLDALQL